MRAARDVILLLFVTEEKRKSVLDRTDLDKWFLRVLPWSPDIVLDSQSAWISVFRIPVHFWSPGTFENIAQLWGSLVRLDENTLEPRSFEQARMLIETKQLERIEETIEVDCNGKFVPIRVQEVEVIHPHDIVCQCEMVDDSSENTDNSKEGRDVPRDAPTVSSAARVIQGQGDMGNTVEVCWVGSRMKWWVRFGGRRRPWHVRWRCYLKKDG
ncbi:hypothetical protein V6N13_125435 [Hibiscus sabdariffa]